MRLDTGNLLSLKFILSIMKKLLLILFIATSINSFAQRIAGSEIYYERTGNRAYKITAVVYRSCDSDPLNSINMYVFASNLSQNVSMTRQSIEKINDNCGNPCNFINANGNAGFERHTYTGSINFNQSPYNGFISNSYCTVYVAIRQGGRDNRTTTQGTGMYYNEASINICDSTISNSSPRFSMEPKFYTSINHALSYSPGPTDADEDDSLAFSIEPVLSNHNTNITYNSGYSYTTPITPYCPPNAGYTGCKALPNARPPRGFYFDAGTCTIITTPTDTDLAYIRLKITEFRKINQVWKAMGSVSRDFLIQPKYNPYNNPPYFVTSPLSPDLNLCSESYSFDITAKDDPYLPNQTSADSTKLFYDMGYGASEFKVYNNGIEQSARLTLKGDTSSTIKTRYVTIGAYDKQCNIGLITKTFKITTSPIIQYQKQYTLDSCQTLYTQVTLKDSNTNFTLTNEIVQPDKLKFTFNPSFNMHQNGLHYLTYQVKTKSNCIAYQYDTISVTDAFGKPTLSTNRDTVMCLGAPYSFGFKPSQVDKLDKWAWYFNDTMVNNLDSFISGSLYSKSELVLRLYNDIGCQSERSIHISPYNKNNYQLFQASSYTLCPNIKTDVTFNTSGLKWPIATHWEYDGQITDSFNAPLNITTPGGLSTKLLRLQVKDDNHCVYKDSIFISGTEDPSFEIQSDKSFCKDSLLTFQIKNLNNPNINNILWTDLSLVIVYQRDSLHLRRQVKTPEYIVASVHDIHNCSYRDTIKIEPIETPDVKIAPLQEVCEGQVIKVVTNTSSPGNIQYQWRINNTKLDSSGSKITWVSPVGSGTIYLSSNNNGACFDFDSVQYTVNPVPVVNIIGDTLYSIYDTIQLQSANQHMLYRWNNNSNLNSSKFSQPANTLGVGLHKIMLRGTNQFYCEASDTISIRIEKPNSIDGNHLNDILIYPNPASETLSIQTQIPVSFKLMSIGGMVLISGTSEENEFSIDIKGLASGVYFIVINEHCYKFVKT